MRTTPVWRGLAVIGAVVALLATGMAPAAAAVVPTGNFDFRALGARISGAVGDQAEIKLGFRNDGPTAPDRSDTGTPVTIVDVTMPKGTTAVGVPSGCQTHANENATIYRCEPGPVVAIGETVTFPFTVRIDSADVGSGTVRINVRCGCDAATIDLNGSNDTAPIEIKVSGGPGDLLSVTFLVIAVGALLVAAAVVGLVIFWRRRNRVEDEPVDEEREVEAAASGDTPLDDSAVADADAPTDATAGKDPDADAAEAISGAEH